MIFESISSALNFVLDPVLNPLLNFSPIVGIAVISLLVAVFSSLAYKYFTDQDLMHRLKAEIKELQAEAKQLRDKPDEMMQVNKRMMETNRKYMMQSFRPMIVTFIPLIILFSWLAAHLAFNPILPLEEFTVTVEVKDGLGNTITLLTPQQIEIVSEANQTINGEEVHWTLKGEEGVYDLRFQMNGKEFTKEVIITPNKGNYAKVEEPQRDEIIKNIRINNEKIKILPTPFWNGWLASYIIFSLIFSLLLRKGLKIA